MDYLNRTERQEVIDFLEAFIQDGEVDGSIKRAEEIVEMLKANEK